MAEKITKNISLTAHLDRFIEQKVRSGRYQSASEVVREGLRLMEERDAALASTRKRIEEGWRQSERGEGRDGERVFAEKRRQLAGRLLRRATAKAKPRRAKA
jgi:antitoxin ParD1/3/4